MPDRYLWFWGECCSFRCFLYLRVKSGFRVLGRQAENLNTGVSYVYFVCKRRVRIVRTSLHQSHVAMNFRRNSQFTDVTSSRPPQIHLSDNPGDSSRKWFDHNQCGPQLAQPGSARPTRSESIWTAESDPIILCTHQQYLPEAFYPPWSTSRAHASVRESFLFVCQTLNNAIRVIFTQGVYWRYRAANW